MENKNITPPDNQNYEYSLQQAYRIACDNLLAFEDIEEQCRKSGSQFRKSGDTSSIEIPYLGKPVRVTLPEITVTYENEDEVIPLREKVLILHYFISAKGTPPSGRYKTYGELPEGAVYLRTFTKRTIMPVVDRFGKEPEKLLEAGKVFGGTPADIGDVSVTIPAFSAVPVTYVLWAGDDEFSPEGNLLFDANVTDYLPTEDITIIGEILAWKLVRSAR